MQSPIRPVSFLIIAELFERMAYYGVRSLLILFLTQTVLLDRDTAIDWYGTYTLIVYISAIIGGLTADLSRLPALIAIIGNSLATVGIFALAFADSELTVYCASAILAFGSGMYKPAAIAALYRASFTVRHRFDFIFTIFYVAINIGAFIAHWVIGGFGNTDDPESFRTGFIVAGFISLLPTALLALNYKALVYNDLIYNNQTYRSNEITVLNLVLWFLASVTFWVGYEMYHTYANVYSSSGSQLIMAFISLTCYIILLPLSLIRNFRSALKIAIGLALVAMATAFLGIAGVPPGAGLLILALAEVLVAPIIMSQIMLNAPPRFNATIMAGFMLTTLFTNKIASTLTQGTPGELHVFPAANYFIAGICVSFVIVLLVLDRIQKKRETPQALPRQAGF
jgi:dipeptide/tripeptide permease